jgi:hypothetical protein
MNAQTRDFFKSFLIRLLIAAPLVGIGLWLVGGSASRGGYMNVFIGVCFAAFFFIIAACIIVPPILDLVASVGLSSVLFPDRPQDVVPLTSVAEGLVKQGEYEKALARYDEEVLKFSQHLDLRLAMIEVALVKMGDPERAEELYQTAMDALLDPADRGTLTRLYHDLRQSQRPLPADRERTRITVKAKGTRA